MEPTYRRFLSFASCLVVILGACAGPVVSPEAPEMTQPATATVLPTSTATPTAPPTPTPVPTATPTPPAATPIPDPALRAEGVILYPRPVAPGDRVTLDVWPEIPPDWSSPLTVTVALPRGGALEEPVLPQGFDQHLGSRFFWDWDTSGLTGVQTLTFTLATSPDAVDLDPSNNFLSFQVTLQPLSALAPPEPGTRWATRVTPAFRIHYLTGTAAERDLDEIAAMAEAAYVEVIGKVGGEIAEPVDLYLLARVVGQAGYATSQWVAISYTDRGYTPARLDLLLRHELTHRLDDALGCRDAPSVVREGLAVTVAGGHYWPESFPRQTASLLALSEYIPLEILAEDFYLHQHEIGYKEAGAFVTYVLEAKGWEGIRALCRAATVVEGSEAAQLSAGLDAVGLGTLSEFEKEWQRWLRALNVTSRDTLALETEWRLLETMRSYQAAYDPVANFLSGILFNPAVGESMEITADFIRRPRHAEAITLELLLIQADRALRTGDVGRANEVLAIVNNVLEQGFPISGGVVDLLSLVRATLAAGHEPFDVICERDEPVVERRTPGGCQVEALDLSDWPQPRRLWAAPSGIESTGAGPGSWTIIGSQDE
ncbi:MAG: hypothetical protein JXB35_01455 [Anaerolineae bacterium]|nr:hypothetical protein [Anaerolineae bacterium]